MLRSRPGLKRRRQVQMRDPQVPQVRAQLPGGGEAKARGQLEPVCGTELDLAHASRFSITIERDTTGSSVRAPYLALPGSADGSAVVSSSVHWAPKRRRGSMKALSSWWALNRIRNESS